MYLCHLDVKAGQRASSLFRAQKWAALHRAQLCAARDSGDKGEKEGGWGQEWNGDAAVGPGNAVGVARR